ncbi:MAG: methionine--tRNA ligase [Candidatus Paceibacterota bacterium]|jgi:methionyl-tRNA synthetase
MSARYITTTLPYVNASPHIGFALELVQADALARTWRNDGEEVFFSTGTDEHGQKIFEAAEKSGQDPQAYVDQYAAEFEKLKSALDISYDSFIRTTSPMHSKAVQEMWRRCAERGDIYKKEYEGLYCVGHEAFVTEKDLVGGMCVDHGTKPELLKETNYFFKFSNYQDRLIQYLEQPGVIVPEWRRSEAINFVKSGLEDFSISREKARLTWGIPVPGDDSQVMYVWFDALTNYISTLGWPSDAEGNFKKFWVEGNTLQIAGKDQVRFQSLMWQAMLMSAEIRNTDTIFYHGFINSSGGQKMSKSLGNVISPYDLVKKYGTDATRYILLRHIHPTEDSDVTWERLDEWYTANLTNGLGNLVARVMKLSESHLDSYSVINPREDLVALEQFNFQGAMDSIWARIQKLDQEITEKEPFKIIKSDPEKGKQIIDNLRTELFFIAHTLKAYMPKTSETIEMAVLENKKPENLFPRL